MIHVLLVWEENDCPYQDPRYQWIDWDNPSTHYLSPSQTWWMRDLWIKRGGGQPIPFLWIHECLSNSLIQTQCIYWTGPLQCSSFDSISSIWNTFVMRHLYRLQAIRELRNTLTHLPSPLIDELCHTLGLDERFQLVQYSTSIPTLDVAKFETFLSQLFISSSGPLSLPHLLLK